MTSFLVVFFFSSNEEVGECIQLREFIYEKCIHMIRQGCKYWSKRDIISQ